MTGELPILRQREYWSEARAEEVLGEYAKTWSDKITWEQRAAAIRQGILKGAELLSLPSRGALNPIFRGKRTYAGYTVENVAFESIPGYYVMANLYRPIEAAGKVSAILRTHGHGKDGRYGSSNQVHCATLARMGAVVLSISMAGYNDSTQYPHDGPKVLALQLWNCIRAVDFLSSLPEVDSNRIGVTGESGGGTQAFLLAAVDERVKVTAPVVMVSAHFFGGCLCESGMPIHVSNSHDTVNAEIAALAAPRPQLIVSDGGDWTKNVPRVEFPYIQSVYRVYGAENLVENAHFPDEGHDYGPSKRNASYAFFSKHFDLDVARVDEEVVTIENAEDMRVFGGSFPMPPHALTNTEQVEAYLSGEMP